MKISLTYVKKSMVDNKLLTFLLDQWLFEELAIDSFTGSLTFKMQNNLDTVLQLIIDIMYEKLVLTLLLSLCSLLNWPSLISRS